MKKFVAWLLCWIFGHVLPAPVDGQDVVCQRCGKVLVRDV